MHVTAQPLPIPGLLRPAASRTGRAAPRPRRWTRREYDRMGRAGILGEDDRVQLLDGEIVQMAAMGSRHAVGCVVIVDALRPLVGAAFHVRVQLPLSVGEYSEPEPDVAVVSGAPRDYLADHPKTAALVVEVADSSYGLDRGLKAALYAAAGVLDYWILELRRRRLQVRRDPVPAPEVRGGGRYRQVQVLGRGDRIAPLFAADHAIAVVDLLP